MIVNDGGLGSPKVVSSRLPYDRMWRRMGTPGFRKLRKTRCGSYGPDITLQVVFLFCPCKEYIFPCKLRTGKGSEAGPTNTLHTDRRYTQHCQVWRCWFRPTAAMRPRQGVHTGTTSGHTLTTVHQYFYSTHARQKLGPKVTYRGPARTWNSLSSSHPGTSNCKEQPYPPSTRGALSWEGERETSRWDFTAFDFG